MYRRYLTHAESKENDLTTETIFTNLKGSHNENHEEKKDKQQESLSSPNKECHIDKSDITDNGAENIDNNVRDIDDNVRDNLSPQRQRFRKISSPQLGEYDKNTNDNSNTNIPTSINLGISPPWFSLTNNSNYDEQSDLTSPRDTRV
jgi:hypothetical protein